MPCLAVPLPELPRSRAFTAHCFGDVEQASKFALRLICADRTSHKGFLRLADASRKTEKHKLAMLAYAQAWERAEEERVEGLPSGDLFLPHELDNLPTKSEVTRILLAPWTDALRLAVSDLAFATLFSLEPRTRLVAEDIALLASPHIGIRRVLTLTKEQPLPASWFMGTMVKNTFLPITNEHAPSIEEMDIVVRLLLDEENVPLLVHCGGGKGRAGTVAACHLATFGFAKADRTLTQPTMSATEAIATLRAIRPGSVETRAQEAFVSRYCSTLWKRRAILPPAPAEPPPSAVLLRVSSLPTPTFSFVGLPGAGKTPTAPTGSHLQGTEKPVCVLFDYPSTLCIARAQERAGHPTLPPGGRVRAAVAQMAEQFQRPTLNEGFAAIAVVRSLAAADELVRRLSPPAGLFKFPRTAHLLDLGGAADDDVVLAQTPVVPPDTTVVITEKLDGANMGFSLGADGQLLAQNRSHYVHAGSHAQFRALNIWLATHSAGLRNVLGCDARYPERYVLFGEWLAARHSVGYSRLPGRFVAFDLYDRARDAWLGRKVMKAALAKTSIPMVPLLHTGKMPSNEELLATVTRQSSFSDETAEGIVVKMERGGLIVFRGKVVRADFIAGNEHWTHHKLEQNQIAEQTID
ncbi:hypothetical protein BD626DRAFT_625633 [Schizophyllum amplum]|uniref:Tyrosine specific protein phosphatases domain-containing protein n=1 Tax=Schizophyllum amplum TaxID=97359 RepID=A0A550D093_9AGAR|nr:hypothetical protein BD626DRAFT_625633 [Auriculariopsis ampla]